MARRLLKFGGRSGQCLTSSRFQRRALGATRCMRRTLIFGGLLPFTAQRNFVPKGRAYSSQIAAYPLLARMGQVRTSREKREYYLRVRQAHEPVLVETLVA